MSIVTLITPAQFVSKGVFNDKFLTYLENVHKASNIYERLDCLIDLATFQDHAENQCILEQIAIVKK